MFGDLLSLDFGGFGSDAGSALVSEPSSGFDWGSLGSGFAGIGKDIAKSTLPALAGAGASMAINKLMPGKEAKPVLVDTRQGVTRAGGDMALDRAKNIQQNPTSFGLPGDPNDPSTPAGKKKYDIVQNARSADAARGSFTTGGSGARETNAVNTAVGNEYNKVWGDSMNTLSGQPAMEGYMSKAEENPWGQIIGAAVSPAVSKGLSSLLAQWGMSA